MSLATVIGIVVSLAFVRGSILHTTTNLSIFWELSGFLIVVGLTFSTAFMSYESRYVMAAIKLIPRIVLAPRIGRHVLRREVGRVIRWGYAVQKGGMPSLEAEAARVPASDKFVRFGLTMVITGYKGDQVRRVLTNMLESMFVRNTVPAEILRNMMAAAPTFGMLATVIGLIMMLGSMGSNPEALGAAMGVAMSGTLYGVALARLVFMPAQAKIQ